MRDDPEYWETLSTRIVSEIRDQRASRFGWRAWAAPLVAAAALAMLIARGNAPSSTAVQPPNIAVLLAPEQQQTPSIAVLLRGEP